MKNGRLLSNIIAGLLVMAIGGGVLMYGDIQSIKEGITNIQIRFDRTETRLDRLEERDWTGR